MNASPTAVPSPETPAQRRNENLALVFQEMLTAVVRLRSNRQAVNDAESFRNQVRQAIRLADQEGRKLGYTEDDIRLGVFAVVAFLDESVLNLQNPVFSDWVRKPLQEELFGRHTAGEIFFEQLQHLMGRRETTELADLLEVYQLCLLLGFVGRYSISGRGDLRAIIEALNDKIRRIRKPRGEISPSWQLPEQKFVQSGGDPWVKRLQWVALGSGILVLLLFVMYKVFLGSGLTSLQSLVR
ncbi:DotU family type IV/VI secretion system protein [Paludibaculum fermentans]|uniref:DotU family type IV/VI secretion system protein n=1 Tax=Paludibaculum fermentans TaxID=1473598 RepID=UPI001E3B295E|nr:DotU family type IV/VI secretion system protein [Paludibaculum fermentans]